jgi:predicted alpha/beta superfamily hydrolase
MKIFNALLFFLMIHTVFAQQDNHIISIGKIDSVQSGILNEKRKIWIHLPESYSNTTFSKQRYPVVYLLDGDAHFSSVVGMMQQLSTVNGNTVCPEMIVVGIPNTDRTRDLTPTHVTNDPPYVDSAFASTSGGGEQFMAFIEKELIPYVESTYPTQPYRLLIGHSLGGLTVMNTLIHHTSLFNSYICIDPSMWWDREKLLKGTAQALKGQSFQNVSLYLGIANTMEKGMTIQKVKKDTAASSRHIRAILALQGYLEQNKSNGLHYAGKYYGDDDHGSVPLITEYDAFRFIFKDYPIHFDFKDFQDTTDLLLNKIVDHFQRISKTYGYTINPPESLINGLGYQSLSTKQYSKAKSFFLYNIKQNPSSFNAYDSYGDYLDASGDLTEAIEQYKKSLSIKENPESRKKLEALENKLKSATDLNLYVGEYVLGDEGIRIKIFVKDGVLKVLATDRPESELVPAKQHEFTVKGQTGYLLQFEVVNGKSVAINLDVPEGMFKAVLKKP